MADDAALARLLDIARNLDRPWSSAPALTVNGASLRVVRFEGWFPEWHSHASDECYVVLEGAILVAIKGQQSVELAVGDAYVVRAGVVHRPMALPEATILLVT